MDLLARQRAATVAGWRRTVDALPTGAWAQFDGVAVHDAGVGREEWTGAYVTSPTPDLAAADAWFAGRGASYGVLVPLELAVVPPGRKLLQVQPVMLRALDAPVVPAPPPGVRLEPARDGEVLARLQAEAFGDPLEAARAFVTPTLGVLDHVVALRGGEPVGCAVGVRAGPAVGVYGVAVAASERRRGVGAALTAELLRRAQAARCDLAHLNPSDLGRSVYAALGFRDAPGYRIWVAHG